MKRKTIKALWTLVAIIGIVAMLSLSSFSSLFIFLIRVICAQEMDHYSPTTSGVYQ